VSTINSWYASEHGGRSLKGRVYTAPELARTGACPVHHGLKGSQALLRSGLRVEDVELVYNAVDVAPVLLADDGRLRCSLGLPKDAVVCTAVGRLVPVKGFEVLVEAAREACRRVRRLVCVIVGEGDGRRDWRASQPCGTRRARDPRGGLPRESSRLFGQRFLRDVFAVRGLFIVLEAAALGLSIVAFCTGGIFELVTDSEHALLVFFGSFAQLAVAIVRLCEVCALAHRFGQQVAR
jgi:glycosyltransferase involved in cell wall biosynthesis